ncbi:MAG TPA: tetratricopeptide repeat protein [Candidatus Methanoperedens sp.]|nr:tetratricopeptide repeat protein [Candidatus Methanoperedens sp.]
MSLPASVRLRRALCLLLVLAATAATFLPVLDNGFTSGDDEVYLTGNPLVRDLSWQGARKIFTSYVSGNYHPLVFLLHAVEFKLFGLQPRPYHALSLALHLAAAALVFELLLLLGGGLPAATAGALLFALHPTRVETVAWVADRKDLLAAVFCLAALVAYLRGVRGDGRRLPWLVFPLFVFALLSKGTAVTLPLALLLCDFLFGRLDRRAVREKLPLLALSLVFGAVALLARGSYQGILAEGSYRAPEILYLGVHRLAWHYPARFLLPVTGVVPLYPPLGPGMGFDDLRLLAWVGLIAVACGAALLSLRRTRKVAFGAGFFLLNLLPSLPVTVLGFSADRFAYLPAFGLAYLAGEAFQRLWDGRAAPRGSAAPAARRFAAGLALLGLSAALALLSWRQCAVWRDSVTLWTEAVASYPEAPGHAANRAWAHYYRGLAHRRHGDTTAALADFTRALELDPGKVEAYNERGIIRTEAGDTALAIADFQRGLEIDAGNPLLNLNLGILHLNAGEPARALPFFERALERDAASAAAHMGRARALFARGEHRRSLEDLNRAEALGYAPDPALRRALAERPGR